MLTNFMSSLLSPKKKAILQRYLVDHFHGREAQKRFYTEMFAQYPTTKFVKPVRVLVKQWFDWLVGLTKFDEQLTALIARYAADIEIKNSKRTAAIEDVGLNNPIVILDEADIVHDDRRNLERRLVKSFLGFDIADIVTNASSNEHYNLHPHPENKGILIERFEWFEITSKNVTNCEIIAEYAKQSKAINRKCRELLLANVVTEKDDTVDKIILLQKAIVAASQPDRDDIHSLILYMGSMSPCFSKQDDIFSIKYPIVFVLPRFLSASASYRAARIFSRKSNVIFRLKVETKEFTTVACVWENTKEYEVLFNPGHHIRLTGISRGEDGIPILDGVILPERTPIPYTPSYGGGAEPPKHTSNGTSENSANDTEETNDKALFDKVLDINGQREGTAESPYVLLLD